jgi:hypothetical protein
MAFANPALLWALFALAIPVIIHLYQLRRFKRIDFPNTRLLAEVSLRTRARRQVRHWLVLAARLLALAALVLAFAQPYVPGADGANSAGRRAVSLFIDDSYSMDGAGRGGRLLDQARMAARDAVMAHAPADRFQVLTGALQGRQQTLLDRDDALQATTQVEVGPWSRPLAQVMTRQREALATSDAPGRRAFLFTDLQRSTTDVENWTNDTLVPTVIVPIGPAVTDNLSVDSAWFDSPVRRAGQSEALHVRVRNHGTQDMVNVPLRLTINGKQRALATFSVQAGAVADTVLRFASGQPGLYVGEVAIDDQPVTFDDRLHLAYRVTERLRVLLVGGGDPEGDARVRRVFAGDSLHRFEERPARALDLTVLDDQDLVVLNAVPEVGGGLAQALGTFVENGGSVVLFPPAAADPATHAALLGAFNTTAAAVPDTQLVRVERIDLEQPFYRDIFQNMPRNVDLPSVRQRWRYRVPAGSEVPLRLRDGEIYMARVSRGEGSLYLWAGALASRTGNLTDHGLFAYSLLRMAELSRPMGQLYHTIGAELVVPVPATALAGERPPRLLGPGGVEALPGVRRPPQSAGTAYLVLHDQELPEGVHALVDGRDTLELIAFNLPRRESDLRAWAPDDLRAELERRGLTTFTVLDAGTGDLSLRLAELDRGRKLWKWFVIAALLFLLAETILIRSTR